MAGAAAASARSSSATPFRSASRWPHRESRRIALRLLGELLDEEVDPRVSGGQAG